MENINHKLRLLRKERGLTLSDLAEKMGTDHQHISRIERGKSRLTVDFLMKLANALDTPLEGLVDGSAKAEPMENKPPAPFPPSQKESSTNVSLLATILEKIESTSRTHQIDLSSQQKAFLASEIYSESLKVSQLQDPEEIQKSFINFSTSLLESVYKYCLD